MAAPAKAPSRSAKWLRSPMTANPTVLHATLFKVMSTILLMQSVLRAWSAEFRRDWQAMARATPLRRIKQVFLQWLQQPIQSAAWRPAKVAQMQPHSDVVPQKT